MRVGFLAEARSRVSIPEVAAEPRRGRRAFGDAGAHVRVVSVPARHGRDRDLLRRRQRRGVVQPGPFRRRAVRSRARSDASLSSLYVETRTRGFGAEVKRRILLGTFALVLGLLRGLLRPRDARAAAPGARLRARLRGGGRHRVPVDSGARVPARREDGRSADRCTSPTSSRSRRRSPGLPAISIPSGLTPEVCRSASRSWPPASAKKPLFAAARAFEREIGFPLGRRRRRRVRTRRSVPRGSARAALLAVALLTAAASRRPAREDGRRLAGSPGGRSRKETRSSCRPGPCPARASTPSSSASPDDPSARKEILGRRREACARDRRFVRVPYARLSATYRKIAIEALFPDDTADAGGWEHRVTAPAGQPESLWRIAEWFTGDGAKLSRDPGGGRDRLARDARRARLVRISGGPSDPGLPERGRGGAAPAEPAAARVRRGRAGPLCASIGCRRARRSTRRSSSGSRGACTPRTSTRRRPRSPQRSGIADVRCDPGGLPGEDPGRRPRAGVPAARTTRSASRRRRRASRPRSSPTACARANLSGVTFVLDAGHGGRDTGAIVEGVEEARVRLRHRVPRRGAPDAPHEGPRRAHGRRRRTLLDRGDGGLAGGLAHARAC